MLRDFTEGSEEAAESLTILDKDGEELEKHTSDKGVYVTVGSTDIADKDESYELQESINEVLDGMQDLNSAYGDIKFLTELAASSIGAQQSFEAVSLSAQAGLVAETVRLTQSAHDSVTSRAMSGSARGLWVEALAGWTDSGVMDAGKGSSAYETDSYGILMGLGSSAGDWDFGGAFHYQDGDLESESSGTQNDFKVWGATLYGVKSFDNGWKVGAALSYAMGDHEFSQANVMRLSGKADTSALIGGVRVAKDFDLGAVTLTPYAGLEAVYVKSDGYTAKANGVDAFKYSGFDETFGRVPVGVKAQLGHGSFSGFVDASVTPQFGNTDAQETVKGVNLNATDTTAFDYADSVIGTVKFGGSWVKERMSFGLTYGASLGDVRDLSHEFRLNALFMF